MTSRTQPNDKLARLILELDFEIVRRPSVPAVHSFVSRQTGNARRAVATVAPRRTLFAVLAIDAIARTRNHREHTRRYRFGVDILSIPTVRPVFRPRNEREDASDD